VGRDIPPVSTFSCIPAVIASSFAEGGSALAEEETAQVGLQLAQGNQAGKAEVVGVLFADDTQLFSSLRPFRHDGTRAIEAYPPCLPRPANLPRVWPAQGAMAIALLEGATADDVPRFYRGRKHLASPWSVDQGPANACVFQPGIAARQAPAAMAVRASWRTSHALWHRFHGGASHAT
jgi:hypothetical protein